MSWTSRACWCLGTLILAMPTFAEVTVSVRQKLTAVDAAAGDEFGFSVWTDGQVLAVGALEDDDNGEASGSVYLYRFDGVEWRQTHKLLAPDGEAGDQFGQVRVRDGVLAVAARRDDVPGAPNAGSVYLFEFQASEDLWEFQQQLVASGASLADICTLSGLTTDRLAMPCTRDDPGGITDGGSLFVFVRDDDTGLFQEVAQLAPLALAPGDNFGGGLLEETSGSILGASRGADIAGQDAGALWVFEQDPANENLWLEVGPLLPADLQAGDEYGARGGVAGDTLAMSAPEADGGAEGAGAVYLFARDAELPLGWRELRKLVAAEAGTNHNLGRGLTWLTQDLLVAGAPNDDAQGIQSGTIYVFRRDECGDDAWGQAARFTPLDVAPGDLFGRQMSAAEGVLAVSAWSHDGAAPDAGAVYLLDVSDPLDSDGDGVLDDRDNCSAVANGDQRDSNGDGYGNRCDADLDDSGRVTRDDLLTLIGRLFTDDADADLDGDGQVTLSDFTLAREQLFRVPGPSGPVRCMEQQSRPQVKRAQQ